MEDENKVTVIPRQLVTWYLAYAAFPTSNKVGDLAYAEDRKVVYRWNGATWQAITTHSSSGTLLNRPTATNLPAGSIYYVTDYSRLDQVQSGTWVTILNNGAPTLVKKTEDETLSNSAVVQNDDALYLAIGANEIWNMRFVILVRTYAGDTGFKIQIAAPAEVTWLGVTPHSMAPGETYTRPYTDTSANRNLELLTNEQRIIVIDVVIINGVNAGNIQFQWAQVAAQVVNTVVKRGSILLAWRVA